MLSRFLLIVLIFCYVVIFQIHDERAGMKPPQISPALPASVQKVVLGYLSEIGSEFLFVKTAVFLGNTDIGSPEKYVDNLAQNFDVMTDLYPQFIDPYYFSESSLAYVGPEYAARANEILLKGVNAYPANMVLLFFRGFNYFYYMDKPKRAAEIFTELGKRPDAPSWLGHLAGVLAARGGDLYGGLMTLRAMLSTEKDELMQERYRRDIVVFENAIKVYEAVEAYKSKFAKYPEMLQDLVPDFLEKLPTFEDGYSLRWDSPTLRLIRPIKKGEE